MRIGNAAYILGIARLRAGGGWVRSETADSTSRPPSFEEVVAGLLSHATCQQNADVNRSGRLDAIDATLVLQVAAGLLSGFP